MGRGLPFCVGDHAAPLGGDHGARIGEVVTIFE